MALNDRGFSHLQLIPITGFRLEFIDVQITNVYTDIKWYSQTKVWASIGCTLLKMVMNPDVHCL